MPEALDTMVVTVGKMIGGVEKNAIAINLSILRLPGPRPLWAERINI
jgi:hypothetical protein